MYVCILSLILSWLSAYYYIGDEFKHFLDNFSSTLAEINQIGGIIHPVPFSGESNSARAFKNLFLIALSIVISLDLILKKKSILPKNFIFILFIISLICFLTYGYAIGRSDGPHIKSTFGYTIIFYSSLLIYLMFKFIENKNILLKKNYINYSFFISIFLIFFLFFKSINIENIYNFKKRLNEYVFLKDEIFLNKKEINFINDSKQILKNTKCIQIFSNDVLMLYLLRKPNCTKFYFPVTIGSEKNQKILIKNLEYVEIILSDNNYDEFSPNYRLRLLKDHINKNYKAIYKQSEWIIMESNN